MVAGARGVKAAFRVKQSDFSFAEAEASNNIARSH
jgi:hypothetical protein